MNTESFDITELARYLQRDARDLSKLAAQGRIPGRRVGGDWRFSQSEVNEWLEGELRGLSDSELAQVEIGVGGGPHHCAAPGLVVTAHLSEQTLAVPLKARTKQAVLRELVETANGQWQVYDPARVVEAIRAREELAPTAWPGGVAVPHPRRPIPDALGETVIAFGKSLSGIPFGGPKGGLTDLFFLVLAKDQTTHLQILARLSRMLQRERLFDQLRDAQTTAETFAVLLAVEEEVLQ